MSKKEQPKRSKVFTHPWTQKKIKKKKIAAVGHYYCYKNNHASSLVKHMGGLFHDYLTKEWYTYDSMAGSSVPTLTRIYDIADWQKTVESVVFATEVALPRSEWHALLQQDKWTWAPLPSCNCCAHCLHFLQQLENKGCQVNNKAKEFLQATQRNDLAMVGWSALCTAFFFW